jgi:hypothetical protein
MVSKVPRQCLFVLLVEEFFREGKASGSEKVKIKIWTLIRAE